MKVRRILAAVSAVLLLSGCQTMSLSGRDILSPPRAAGDRADIQQMIEKDAGSGYELLVPAAGDYKSGIILRDLDRDGADEAVALYTTRNGGAKVLAAKKSAIGYKNLGSCALSSANISSMRFADIDADGCDEILISCDAGTSDAALSVFAAHDTLEKTDVAQGFTDYLTGDLDGNKVEDVIVLRPASAAAAAMAELWTYENGAFAVKSSCEIDPTAAAYPSLQCGMIGEEIKGAVADSVTADGKYSTQLIFYDTKTQSLTNPLFVSANYASYGRTVPLYARDIDGDGVIEFPLCSLTAHGAKEDLTHVSTLTQWCCYDPDNLTPQTKVSAILCEPCGFLFKLSDELAATVTARYDGEGTFTIHSLTYKGTEPQLGAVLLTIKRYTDGSFDSASSPEKVLSQKGPDVLTYILSENAPLTDAEVKNSFLPLEAQAE